jgi:hypothetical protein
VWTSRAARQRHALAELLVVGVDLPRALRGRDHD